MTALTQERARSQNPRSFHDYTLASGFKAYRGAQLVYNTSTNKVEVATGTGGPNLVAIGTAVRTVDATLADKTISVEFPREVALEWYVNDTAGTPIAATDVFKTCFLLDDQTVTAVEEGHTPFGVVWGVDSAKGVLVARRIPGTTNNVAPSPAVGSYTANDYAPAALANGAVLDVPTTAAASTITLPAAAPDGTIVQFAADGTKNGHTVQYRDATGPTNLTTALTASKRHLVVCAKREGKWFANAYVSP